MGFPPRVTWRPLNDRCLGLDDGQEESRIELCLSLILGTVLHFVHIAGHFRLCWPHLGAEPRLHPEEPPDIPCHGCRNGATFGTWSPSQRDPDAIRESPWRGGSAISRDTVADILNWSQSPNVRAARPGLGSPPETVNVSKLYIDTLFGTKYRRSST
ncbi:hypothetical protein BC826DRAFT_297204 [Russula brevipes]|nr:hypothetical protein BC826DRAFT_297204 [Russula brevipes]